MPQSNFFIRKSRGKTGSLKRKRTNEKQTTGKHKKKNEKSNKMQEIISSDEEYSGKEDTYPENFSSDEETEQEKKLRLTKKYLAQVEEEEREKNELDDTREAVSRRLKDEALEEAGRLQKKRAHEFENQTPMSHVLRGHQLSITCIAVSSCEKYFFSASKDGAIIKWNLEEKKKLQTIRGGKKGTEATHCGHFDSVQALALSSDDTYLASGCRQKVIHIWNPETMKHLKTFTGHKNGITGLVFLKGSHQLISASSDRSLKLWNLDEMGYVETLFGHQDAITGIDCFLGETALTSGGRDNTLRIWKIAEESQLVFQANNASIDCVCVSSFQSFVSGGDDGSLLLWGTQKKKPMAKLVAAHGLDPETEEGNWIVALCALPNTDLVASGSKDGFIRLWKRDDDNHALTPVSRIPVCGFVNSLQFTSSGKYLIAGIGKEHRLGRWWKVNESRNSIVIYSWENKS